MPFLLRCGVHLTAPRTAGRARLADQDPAVKRSALHPTIACSHGRAEWLASGRSRRRPATRRHGPVRARRSFVSIAPSDRRRCSSLGTDSGQNCQSRLSGRSWRPACDPAERWSPPALPSTRLRESARRLTQPRRVDRLPAARDRFRMTAPSRPAMPSATFRIRRLGGLSVAAVDDAEQPRRRRAGAWLRLSDFSSATVAVPGTKSSLLRWTSDGHGRWEVVAAFGRTRKLSAMWGGQIRTSAIPEAIAGLRKAACRAWVPDADARLPLNSLVRVISVSTAPDSKQEAGSVVARQRLLLISLA